MCGRFTPRSSGEAVAEAFGLVDVPDLLPRFNIAPGQPVAVVRQQPRAEGRELALLRWGLVPAWADDPSVGHRLANARSETAATKPSFRRAFRSRRCLGRASCSPASPANTPPEFPPGSGGTPFALPTP